ncbi:PHP domain-containing protein [Tautonia sociabilis]|uniref:PHP domain-containing protein n=1 Tax=Tautonia sociabilis TaxID=2080755 RepID=A0A432MIG0_9BACT|nr:PHP domain-containing protein [Tautonia sociabilis]RUL86936.1 PHP domain-containing protein [Tautonia sociabilis]
MTRRRRPRPRPVDRADRGADLHVHTSHSDGTLSPGEVVRSAAAVGLSAVAITDHDTLSALALALPEADRLGIELVPGIELSARDEGREVHLLGHFVDPDHPELRSAADALRASRRIRLERMIDRLADFGLIVDPEALRRAFPRAALGRKHLADYLVRTGQVPTHRLVFSRFLGDDGPAAVPKAGPTVAEAIALIRRAGGVAGLPHPPYDLSMERLRSYREAGLGALEVDGPSLDRRRSSRWRLVAEQLDLVPIAGSDFHAPDRPGRWVGSITTPAADLDRLRRLSSR